MKKLLVLLISILISFNSYGEWTRYGENTDNDTMYIDYSKIKDNKEFVYFWEMIDNLEPSSTGRMSSKAYIQSNCKTTQSKYLTFIFYNQSMGEGEGDPYTPDDEEWFYPPPESILYDIVESVCDYVD